MAKAMHDIVLTSIRANVQVVNYFSVSANEVITLPNQQWINVHVYVMKDWC
jgi:quinolinate synthase